jgi:hypothetical protein
MLETASTGLVSEKNELHSALLETWRKKWWTPCHLRIIFVIG